MKRVPKESSIQASCIKYLKSLPDTAFLKIHGTAFQGKAFDLVIVSRGVPFAVELKRPGAKLTAIQETTLAMWQKAGAVTARVESAAELRKLLEKSYSLMKFTDAVDIGNGVCVQEVKR